MAVLVSLLLCSYFGAATAVSSQLLPVFLLQVPEGSAAATTSRPKFQHHELLEVVKNLESGSSKLVVSTAPTTSKIEETIQLFQNASVENRQVVEADWNEWPEDVAEDVVAGVEETLKSEQGAVASNLSEYRQFSPYMFQGQYLAEPRLNRFIDGAVTNLRTELRVALMDPLYFRVLPRGQVESRPKPGGKFNQAKKEETQAKARFLNLKQKKANKKKAAQRNRIRNRNRKRKRPGFRPNRNKNKNGIRNGGNRNRNRKKNQRNKNKRQNKKGNQRQKRRTKKNMGGGRVEGLSVCQRDGDAEMQVFGNYTLIRSHFLMGPVELSMQFKTKQGLRRTGATLSHVKVHTVTRVSVDGSEMVDFLLDRPHPETIKVRGRLFPQAQRIARNIFSKLFMPNSFLVSKLREKSALALRARPRHK